MPLKTPQKRKKVVGKRNPDEDAAEKSNLIEWSQSPPPTMRNKPTSMLNSSRISRSNVTKSVNNDIIEVTSSEDEKGTTELDPDDGMFRGQTMKSRIQSSKKPIPDNTPVRTRSAFGIFKKRILDPEGNSVVNTESPSKKKKITSVSNENSDHDVNFASFKTPKRASTSRAVGTLESDVTNVAHKHDINFDRATSQQDVQSSSKYRPTVKDVTVVREEPMEPSSDHEAMESCDLDEYDLADPFIDDATVDDEEYEQTGREQTELPLRHKGKAKARFQSPLLEVSKNEYDVDDEEARQLQMATQRSIADVTAPKLASFKLGEGSSQSHGVIKSRSSNAPKTFADMLAEKKKSTTTRNVVHLSDLDTMKLTSLPVCCEVTQTILQDAYLADDYASLPNLRRGTLVSWSNAKGPGQIMLTAWETHCPDMLFDNCVNAIRFDLSGHYVNPSRASPLDVSAYKATSDGERLHLHVKNQPAVNLSSVFVTASNLLTPPQRGLRQKSISGIFHSQEWDRFCGFICMVFGKDELHAQLEKDSLLFSTKSEGMAAGFSPTKQPSGMFNSSISPSTKRGQPKSKTSATFYLDFNADIPVYDARKFNFEYTAYNLSNLDKILDRYDDEIPYGSFAVVGYTLSVYKSKAGKSSLSCNIQWVILLGCPED